MEGMPTPAHKAARAWMLFAILATAFLLRVAGIPWGLMLFHQSNAPYGLHPDEFKFVIGAKSFPKDIFVRTDMTYPTVMHYQLGMLGLPLKLVKDQFPAETYDGLFVVLGRLLSTLLGAGAVGLTYWWGKRIHNQSAGLVASAMLATALYHVHNSSVSTADVASSFWLLVVVIFAERAVKNINPLDYVYLGLSFGILAGTKYPCAIAALLIGGFILRNLLDRSQDVRKTLVGLLACAASSVTAFFLATPVAFAHPDYVFNVFRYQVEIREELVRPIWDLAAWLFPFKVIAQSTNIALMLLSVVGVLITFRKGTFAKYAPYAAMLIAYLAILNTALLARYIIFVMPLLCLFAGRLVAVLWASPRRLLRLSGSAALGLVLSTSVLQNLAVIQMLYAETRTQTLAYISNEVPSSAHVEYFAVNLAETECDFWYTKDELRRLDLDHPPDVLILEDAGWQLAEIPPRVELGRFSSISSAEYVLLKQIDPLWPVQVEFVSPAIKICGRLSADE